MDGWRGGAAERGGSAALGCLSQKPLLVHEIERNVRFSFSTAAITNIAISKTAGR